MTRASFTGATGGASMTTASYCSFRAVEVTRNLLARSSVGSLPMPPGREEIEVLEPCRPHVAVEAISFEDLPQTGYRLHVRASPRRGSGGDPRRRGSSWRPTARSSRRDLPRPSSSRVVPSGLVITIERVPSSAKTRFVRRSRRASDTGRELRIEQERAEAAHLANLGVSGISAKTGTPVASARSARVRTRRPRFSQRKATCNPEAETEQDARSRM